MATPEDKLLINIQSGEIDSIKYSIKKCKTLDYKNECGVTPLLLSIEKGDFEISKLLLDSGADSNAKGNLTEVHYAMGAPRFDKLLEWTPLINAAMCDQPKILELLIERGAELEFRDINGRSALTTAINHGRKKCAEILILHGAQVSIREIKSAEVFCPSLDIRSILKKAEQKKKVQNTQKAPTLHSAAEDGDRERLRELLTKGANINAKNGNGETALHITLLKDHRRCTEFLLTKGADTNILDKGGHSPFHVAVAKGEPDIVKLLAENGANIIGADYYGATALHIAIFASEPLVTKLLLDLGADVNIRLPDGRTPLHLALGLKDKLSIDLLIKEHADIFAKDNNNVPPLALAASISADFFMSLLPRDVNATSLDGVAPIHIAAASPHTGCLERLLKKGADVNAATKEGNTPMHWACEGKIRKSCSRNCRLLLKNGADISKRNELGQTPLHCASARGQLKIVEILLKHGADTNALDKDNNTCLMLAAKPAHFLCIKLLLKHGAFLWGEDN